MEIKKATLDDAISIYRLELECFESPWSYENVQSELENPISSYYIALYGDVVIGYMGFQSIFSEAFITNVAIKKDFRSLGYGKKLMEYFIDVCKKENIARASLEVKTTNKPALSLYSKLGFEIEGKRNNYYGIGKDAYIMWKDI